LIDRAPLKEPFQELGSDVPATLVRILNCTDCVPDAKASSTNVQPVGGVTVTCDPLEEWCAIPAIRKSPEVTLLGFVIVYDVLLEVLVVVTSST
jgi:hypothetical protein